MTRWLEPRPTDHLYGWPVDGRSEPRTRIASLYIEQFPANDVGRATAAKYGVPLYNTIREALTLGGDTLAVDGIILIAEHGDYPWNDLHQKMYPRREYFDQIVEVFRESGRSVPVFNDKHFSYDSESVYHMLNTAKEFNFPIMAGSSVPLGRCMEPWDISHDAPLDQGLSIYHNGAGASGHPGTEINGYHAIEFLQSLVARRSGGEVGIESVTAYTGEHFLEAQASGVWSSALVEAAAEQMRRASAQLYSESFIQLDPAGYPYPFPVGYVFRHLDGLQTTYLMSEVANYEYTIAVSDRSGSIHGGCSLLSGEGVHHFWPNFAALCARIEEFMITGKTPFPMEHYLLCNLAINNAMQALRRPGESIDTPDLRLSYQLTDD
jgi:hypothetical protein